MMPRSSFLVALIAAASLALLPLAADARVGGGGSMGSRGSQTFSAPPTTNTAPFSASPMQRSMTPQTAPSTGQPGFAQPGRSPGFFGGGFASGLMGGLIGAGIGGLLFGHGFFGGGGGFGGFLGLLLQIFLLVMLVRWGLRWFMNRQAMPAGAPGMLGRLAMPGAMPGAMSGAMPGAGMGGGGPALQPIQIAPADFQGFEAALKNIQAAWSGQDLAGLRALVTPEMLSYFSEQLTDLQSRGQHNAVSDVRLLQGDLAQGWTEAGRDYATVAMKFSMIDTTTDATGRIVDGSPTEHVTATELWTFVRSGAGAWLLSAIQQTRS